ncbi:hypothetical protein AB0N28_29080 [Streptomyces sp. NPDC051130]|uniref:hypothetical protein n=1 Tax=Streptomyces sp. NPDC051130 TaxID=3157223 RepID=UPI00343502A0
MRTLPFRAGAGLCMVACLLPLASACGDPGGLASAGTAPTARGPVELWPWRKGAEVPPAPPGGVPPVYVQGLPLVHDQNVHEVDAVALVQAELRAHRGAVTGADGMPEETADAIRACDTEASEKCPVLTPYYRDLTANGKDEVVVGIELPGSMMSVRVYTADPDGRLNRVMATTETLIRVELAGQNVVLHAPSGHPGYELITTWSWDEKQRSMMATREQIVRVPTRPRTS